ncbi:HupE/UreJ family protein [Paraglaciecola aestuariivivens]
MRIYMIFLVLLFSATFKLQAHQMSTAYLQLDMSHAEQSQVAGQFQMRWFDLDSEVKLDKNLDGQLQWHEVLAQQANIQAYISNHLVFSTQQQQCIVAMPQGLQADQHFDEGYLSVMLAIQCDTQNISELRVKYSAVFEQDPEHKLVINVSGIGSQQAGMASQVMTHSQQQVTLNLATSDSGSVIKSYIYQGIVHIFIGTDHILFLVVLVLASVLIYRDGTWLPKQQSSQVFKDTAWVVTAFTLAHSLTLSATALGWIAPSSRWVEVGIALSIVLTALNNIWPVVSRLGLITFAFGLLHGMGFASVLGELGLSQDYTLLSILAFNIGVELGQLVILVVLLPVLLWGRKYAWYPRFGLQLPSFVIALIAINWTIQRL